MDQTDSMVQPIRPRFSSSTRFPRSENHKITDTYTALQRVFVLLQYDWYAFELLFPQALMS